MTRRTISKAVIVLLVCSVAFITLGLTARDPAQPATLVEAKATIAALLAENAALKKENADLRAQIADLMAAALDKKVSPERSAFLAKLQETRGAVEKAADGRAVLEILRTAQPDLAALASKCGFKWAPFEPVPAAPPVSRPVMRGPQGLTDQIQSNAFNPRPVTLTCHAPQSAARIDVSNAASMSDADWRKILDLLSAWEKAVTE